MNIITRKIMNIITRKIKIFFLKRKIHKWQERFKQLYLLNLRRNGHFEALHYTIDIFGWLYGCEYKELIQPLYDQLALLEQGCASASEVPSPEKEDACEHQT